MKHTISVLVENNFGVLARVAGLFSSRGYNIDSLAVGETEEPSISRMTIIAQGDETILEQIMKQLNKLVEILKVVDMDPQESIERELVIAKINVTTATRMEVMQVVQTFRAKIVDVSSTSMIIEVTGTESKVDAMLELLSPYGLKEVVRTGVIAISRNPEGLSKSIVSEDSKQKKTSKASAKKKKVVKKK